MRCVSYSILFVSNSFFEIKSLDFSLVLISMYVSLLCFVFVFMNVLVDIFLEMNLSHLADGLLGSLLDLSLFMID